MNKLDKFWKKYENADLLDRTKILKKIIPKVCDFIHSKELTKHQKDLMLVGYFKSYFDDLIEYMRINNGK